MSEDKTQEMLQDIGEMLKGVLVKMEALETKVEMLEQQDVGLSDDLPDLSVEADRQEAVFHTMKRIANLKAMRDMNSRQGLESALDNAANHAIADYKRNPPKHRG